MEARHAPRKLNLGCGREIVSGWIHCDVVSWPGVDLCVDLRHGLPFAADSIDCIAAIHLLQDLAYPDLAPALREMHRVLRPGGVLRLGLPDLDKAIAAYRSGDARYFCVPDRDARSIGAKLVTQLVWYGSVRTPFTFGFISEWLAGAGFCEVRRCPYRSTSSPFAALATLDNRERESLFTEATK